MSTNSNAIKLSENSDKKSLQTSWSSKFINSVIKENSKIKTIKMNRFDKKQIMETLLRKQTKLHEDKASLFNYVARNDLAGLKYKLESLRISSPPNDKRPIDTKDKSVVENEIDPVGANIIHIAYLLKNYEMGRWLVEHYPHQAILPFENNSDDYLLDNYKLENMPSEKMPYSGENILHVAIVHKNLGKIYYIDLNE